MSESPTAAESPTPDAAAPKPGPTWFRVCAYVVGGLFGVIVLFLAAGMLLPGTYRVEESVVVETPPETVHATITNLRTWPEWTVWNAEKDPTLELAYSGSESGAGAAHEWTSDTMGNGRVEIEQDDPATGMSYFVTFDGMDGRMNARFDYEKTKDGTRVVWVAEGDIGPNPIGRWFWVLMGMNEMIAKDFSDGLGNLKNRLESEAS